MPYKVLFPYQYLNVAGWQETLGLLPAGWQETKKSPTSRLAGDTSLFLISSSVSLLFSSF